MTVGELRAKLAELVLANPANAAKTVTCDVSRGDHGPSKVQELEDRSHGVVLILDEEWWFR